MRYVNTKRIIRSAWLIINTDKLITEIAFECGFETLEAFERSLKKYFGTTAYEFRKNGFNEPQLFYLSDGIYYERLRNMQIDGAASFDWGKTAAQYAHYRNIYPYDFFENLNRMGLNNNRDLDIGTGTGILPLNMAKYGSNFVGVDISAEMIRQADIVCNGIPNVRFIQEMPTIFRLKIIALMR